MVWTPHQAAGDRQAGAFNLLWSYGSCPYMEDIPAYQPDRQGRTELNVGKISKVHGRRGPEENRNCNNGREEKHFNWTKTFFSKLAQSRSKKVIPVFE